MSTFILVHGAWHGSWCWKKVVPLLEAQGHKVEALDLPGHGSNKVPIADISLKLYVDYVCQVIDTQDEPVVLAGHSLGGCTISQAAEKRPEKIKALVYIAAFLLMNDEQAINYVMADTESVVVPNLIMPDDQSYSTVKKEFIKEGLYAECSEEDFNFAQSLLVPESSAPFLTPIVITDEKFGQILRIYISCLRDKAVGPATQERMYTNLPCEKIIPMDTDHSPFFSAPDELARHLIQASNPQ